MVEDERPLKIINAFENKSAAILKLPKYINTYIYVVKYLEEDIKVFNKSQEALNFYYTVEDKRTEYNSFILIYLIVVSLMLFLSVSIAIRFSSRFLDQLTI